MFIKIRYPNTAMVTISFVKTQWIIKAVMVLWVILVTYKITKILYKMWNNCLKKPVLHCNVKLMADFSVLQEMAVMKQAILGLHSSRGSKSQVTRTSTGVHGPESHLRTSAAQDTSSHVTHRPRPTIFVSWWRDSNVHGRFVATIYYWFYCSVWKSGIVRNLMTNFPD